MEIFDSRRVIPYPLITVPYTLAAMLEYKRGDIFHDSAQALVNTVNCVGVMGNGLAAKFKDAYPDNFKAYNKACQFGGVGPGRMFVFETNQLFNPRFIINFPTKRHWLHNSRLTDIESGLKALIKTIALYNIASIAIPALGAGKGKLEWSRVKALIEQYLSDINNVAIRVYEPHG